MSTVALVLFLLLLMALLAYAIRIPSLVLPIGIMTYSYKQIAASGVTFLQNHDTLFNFLIAGPIALVFMLQFRKRIQFSCHSRTGRTVVGLIWIYLVYFWTSSFWSPYTGFDSWKFFPYFVVYFLMIPLLIEENPEAPMRAFQLAWVLTFLAALYLLLSPIFYVSPDIERMVIHYSGGKYEEGNPLAVADMAAYLIMMSLLIALWPPLPTYKGRAYKVLHFVMVSAGLALGGWLAFNTSRAEPITGIACGCLFIALVKGRSALQSFMWLAGMFATIALAVSILLFLGNRASSLEKVSGRFSQSAIVEGSEIRSDMNTRNIRGAMSSPVKFLFGEGARAAEKHLGEWPHNHFVQAFGETGIIGLALLCVCFFLALKFGFQTIGLSREMAHYPSLIFTSFIISLLIYQIIVLSKKGSLTFVDTHMWLAVAAYSFDQTMHFLQSTPDAFNADEVSD